MMKQIMFVVGLTLVSSPVFAAKHCIGKDKTEISVSGSTAKTRAAQCRAAGGRWVKGKKAHAAK